MTDFSSLSKCDNTFEDESYELIRKWSEDYGKEFLASDSSSLLPKFAREQLIDHVSVFSEFCYRYELEKPGQWTEYTVEMVCEDIIPRKVMADEGYVNLLISNVTIFIHWLSDSGELKDGKSLLRGLKRAEEAMAASIA